MPYQSNLSAQIEMLRRQRRKQLEEILSGGGPQQVQSQPMSPAQAQRQGPGPGGPQNVRSLYDTGYGLGQKAGFWGQPQVPQAVQAAQGLQTGATSLSSITPGTLTAAGIAPGSGMTGAGALAGGGMAVGPNAAGSSATSATGAASGGASALGSLVPVLQVLFAGRGIAGSNKPSWMS